MNYSKGHLALIALLLMGAVVSATVFATTNAETTVTVTGTSAAGDVAAPSTYVQSSGPALKYSSGSSGSYAHVSPAWTPVQGAGGTIAAGDLYQIDTTSQSASSTVVLRLMQTNAPALAKNYNYLMQKINIYETSQATPGPADWTQATLADGASFGTIYMTLSDSVHEFLLSGGKKYNVTIEDGSFWVKDVDATDGSLSPAYFLSVK